MNLNQLFRHGIPKSIPPYKQLWRIMKLTFTIITLFLMQVSASTLAQQLTLKKSNASLKQIFTEIRKQTGYLVLYQSEQVSAAKPVTVNMVNEPLSDALKLILKDQELDFTIEDKTIIIKEKAPSVIDKIKTTQQIPVTVKGKVTDTTGTPLVGATIHIKGDLNGAQVGNDGTFAVSAEIGDEVTISFIGYQPYTFTVTENMPFQQIVLYQSSNKLSEVAVVSTGYQTIPKERATGSFSQPIKAEFDDRVAPDVLSKLNGITSGLVFNTNTTASKSGLDINIRGRSTIFANDQPLIVVDNFPYSGDISNINPNDVESVTILKDAAAASIWGVRAGNGVIVLTTKKGKLNQPLKVDFNANLTVFNKPNLNYNPNQLNATSYIDLEKYLFKQGFYDATLTDKTNFPVVSPVVQLLAAQRAGSISSNELTSQLNALSNFDVNNQISKYFYQNATNQQYALNLSGGSEKALYYFSAGYDYDLATVKENSNQRITINSRNIFYPIKKLEISIGINAVQANSKIDNTLLQASPALFPYSQIADINGNALPIAFGYNQSFIQSAATKGFLDWSYSPLKELGARDDRNNNLDIRFTTGLKYSFIKGLSAEIKYQYENSNLQNRDFNSQQNYYTRDLINRYSILTNGQVTGYNIPLGGILGLSNSNVISNNVRAQLNYNLSWKDNEITALLGYELSQVSSKGNSSNLYGYNDNNATFTNINPTTSFITNPSGNYATIFSGLNIQGTLDRIRSTFANVAYTYKNRYTLSGSARVDGSNYFGVAVNKKSLPLWSSGLKWAIDKEDFYNLSWLPVLDLRITYGYNGNLDRSVTGVTTFQYLNNAQYTNIPYAQISNIGNPDLQWEKTGITNFAIDFGSKNNVVSGSFEYYLKKETDLLGFKTFPSNTGISSLEGNYSDMKGKGFDLSILTHNLSGQLKWSTTLLVSHATDKITEYDVAPTTFPLVSGANSSTAIPVLGKPVFGLYSYKWAGLNPTNGNPIGYVNGAKSEDYATIVTNTAINDLIYSGPARPTYFGGINNRFSYKGFSITFQINYKLGYYFRTPTLNYFNITAGQSANLLVNRSYNNRWMKAGDEKTTNVPSLSYPFNQSRSQFYQYSEINVQNAGNIRLQDVSLSYDFNKSNYPKLPFNNLQIYVYGNNLGLLWRANHVGLDPDAVPGEGDITTTINPRSISFGIKGSF